MATTTKRRGFTLTELLVLLAVCSVLLVTVTLTACRDGLIDTASKRTQDAARLLAIYQPIPDGPRMYIRPGLMARHPVVLNEGDEPRVIPGRGQEDVSHDTTAKMYAILVMQNYLKPEDLISPLERNPKVRVYESFDYNLYNPLRNVYWDPGFQADLMREAHVSYAHLVLHGARKRLHWNWNQRETNDPNAPAFSNRGPLDGKPDPKSFTCKPDGSWAGNVAFGDGSVRWLDTMTPEGVFYNGPDGERVSDNIFAVETGWKGADFILSFTLENSEERPVIQHD